VGGQDVARNGKAVVGTCGKVGFAGGTSLREHLHAAIGVTPLAYRRTFRGALATSGASAAGARRDGQARHPRL